MRRDAVTQRGRVGSRRVVSLLARRKMLFLFVFLLGSLLLYPYADTRHFGYFAFRILGSVVILTTVYAVSFRRSMIVLVALLSVPALVERILLPRSHAGTLLLLNGLLSLVFDAVVILILFRHVFTRKEANSETICGALCIYLLIGFSFASLYGIVGSLQPGAFYLDPVVNINRVPDRFDFIYYSFGTMTALGAAGMTAVSAQARSLSVVETILGLLYLAVLISRLMGAYREPKA